MKGFMRHRCTIEQAVETNTDGFVSSTWSVCQTNARCRLEEKKGVFIRDTDGHRLEVDGQIFFPQGTVIGPRQNSDTPHRIRMTRGSSEGVFLCLSVGSDSGGKREVLVAQVKRVAPSVPN